MPRYGFEVVVHGRLNLTVEAENEDEAHAKIWDHADFPEFDKMYESDATLIGEI